MLIAALDVSGNFYEHLELELFPFDSQDLSMILVRLYLSFWFAMCVIPCERDLFGLLKLCSAHVFCLFPGQYCRKFRGRRLRLVPHQSLPNERDTFQNAEVNRKLLLCTADLFVLCFIDVRFVPALSISIFTLLLYVVCCYAHVSFRVCSGIF